MSLLAALLLAANATSIAAAPRDAAWAASLQPGELVELGPGLYRGPWKLGPRVHLRASPGAVLEGGDPVLTIAGSGVVIENLTVRADAGRIGILALEATGTELREVQISGGSIGLKARGGTLSWNGGGCERSGKYGLWMQGMKVKLARLTLARHQGPALYLGHASAELRELKIAGAEYGLLTFESRLALARSELKEIRRAGAGLTLTSGEIVDCTLEGPFSEAALSISSARPFALRGNRIRHAGSIGIKLINSAATLAKNEISGARSDSGGLEGDGLYSNNSQLESSDDKLLDNAGAAVSIMGGTARMRECRITGAGQAAVAVAGKGELSLSRCTIEGGSTELMVSPGSTLENESANP